MQQPANPNPLRRAVSDDRIEGYRRTMHETDVDLFARYQWNTAPSEAQYPILQAFEVTLRNCINDALVQATRPDWLLSVPSLLAPQEQPMLREALARIRAAYPVTPGRVVAALPFGFWTALLDARYEQVFWPAALKGAFPYLPRRRRTRANVQHRVDAIRRLRNRVFHHEPIWHYANLTQLHFDILQTLGWINLSLRDLVAETDRFPAIYQAGPAPFRPPVARALGIRPH